MKNSKMILIGILLFFAFMGVASAHNGIVALVSDDYSSDSDVDALNRDTERFIRSAVEFYGFPCDVIRYDDLDTTSLAEYIAVIAVSPNTPEKAGYIRVYGETNNKSVLCFGEVDNSTLSDYGITNHGKITALKTFVADSDLTDNGMITGIARDFYHYSYWRVTLDTGVTYNAKVISNGTPLILQSEHNGCNLVWVNMDIDQTQGFLFQFIHNFFNVYVPDVPCITGNNPYALDMAILMRYNDYGLQTGNATLYSQYITAFRDFYNISHECTIAAPAITLTSEYAEYISEAEVLPHVYHHQVISSLNESALNSEFEAVETVFNTIYGKRPQGVVLPGNQYSYTVGKVMNERGYKYVCGAATGAETYVNLWGYCYWIYDSDNDLVFVGRQLENPYLTEPEYIPTWYWEHLYDRDYIVVIDHPNHRVRDGTLATALTKFSALVTKTNTLEGYGLLKHGEFVDRVTDGKNAYVIDSNIIVTEDVDPGLSFKMSGLTDQILIDGSIATILNRNNKTMLPALTSGTHSFSYTTEYPYITHYTNGSIIKNGYYHIPTSTMLVTVADDDELQKGTDLAIAGLAGWQIVKQNGIVVDSFNATGNDVLTELEAGTYAITDIPFDVIASNGSVNVSIATWTTDRKIWTESSETHNTVTQHIIGGFPANKLIQINRDGVKYETVESDSTGTIAWTYDGGYSEHEFEALVAGTTEVMSTNISSGIWQSSLGMILVAVVVFFGTMLYQGIKKGKIESDTIILAAKGLLFIAMTLMVGAIILSAF